MQYSATPSLHCLFAQLTAVARLQNAAATTATTGIYLWKLEPAFQGLWLGMASRLEWSVVVSTLALHYRAHITPARIVMAGSMLDLPAGWTLCVDMCAQLSAFGCTGK